MYRLCVDIHEQWDGRGGARGLRGDAIAEPARIAQVAVTAALFDRFAGPEAAPDAVRSRSGMALDPRPVEALCRHARRVLGVLGAAGRRGAATASGRVDRAPGRGAPAWISTGRPVEIQVIDIVRVAGGQIVEHRNCVDRPGLLAQPGALPETTGAPA